MLARFLAGKFRNPTGFWGHLVGRFMAQGNAYEAGWTVALLGLRPGQHVLEIGFGPGVALAHAALVGPGVVHGLDASPTMVRDASARNAAAVRAGRVRLQQGDAAALPYENGAFDAAFAIHCLYFWAQPAAVLRELRRVLTPGGRLALTLLPKADWPTTRPRPPADLFTLYRSEEGAALLVAAGFQDVRVQPSAEPQRFAGVSVLGTA